MRLNRINTYFHIFDIPGSIPFSLTFMIIFTNSECFLPLGVSIYRKYIFIY